MDASVKARRLARLEFGILEKARCKAPASFKEKKQLKVNAENRKQDVTRARGRRPLGS